MTWGDIKVGDRVKVTGHDETHEFTVRNRINLEHDGVRTIMSKLGNCFYVTEGWTVEILQPPLPTTDGLYVTEDWDGVDRGLWSHIDNKWYEQENGEWNFRPVSGVPRDLTPLVKGTRA